MSKVGFARPAEFHKALYSRVRAHLKEHQIPKDGGARILLKTSVIFGLFVGSYAALVFWADQVWSVALTAFLVSQAIVLIGFNVMHDANHGAFSKSRWLNRAMGFSLDLIGGSRWLWNHKHGVLHHNYTNLEVYDDDLDTNGLIRMHPDQPWKPVHRYQPVYALPLYCLLYSSWVVSDFAEFFGRRCGRHEVGYEPSRWQTFFFLMFKVNFVFWGLAVPLYLHPWYLVLPIFLAIQMTVSLILSLVFQFAHVVDGVAMPSLDEEASIDNQWAVHQITTTANFAVNNPFVRWYAGGLNCQIEHHLFTGISHVRYPHIQPVVQEVCAEYNIPYQCYPTVWSAFRAHMRQLVAMSHEPPEPAHELPSQDTALSVG